MSVAGLLRQLRELGVELTLDGERLRVNAPKGVLTLELTEQLRAERESLIALLASAETPRARELEPIVATSPDEPAPLSHAQHRLWFLDRLTGDSAALNLPLTVRLRGRVDLDALRWVVAEIGRRHDALRSVVELIDGAPYQVVRHAELELTLVELRDLPQGEREPAMFARRAKEMSRSLPTDTGPLIRFFLFQLADDDQVLTFVASHLVFDGWSHDLLLREVQALYEARVLGREMPPPPGVRFADFVRWHRRWLEQPEQRKGLEHFQTTLAGMPVNLDFPADKRRPAQLVYPAANSMFRIDGDLLGKLRRVATASGATFNMLALASIQVLVARYSRQDDFGVGVPSQGRQRPEVQDLIGMFVNTLVVRSDVPGGGRFRDLLKRVRDRTVAALAHEDTPFEELVHVLRPVRDRSRTPLYQVMFSYQEASGRKYGMADIQIEQIPSFSGATGTDMTFWMRDHGEHALAVFEATTELFETETIARIARGWRCLLEAIAEDPDMLLEALPVMAAEDERRVVDELNQTRFPYRSDVRVHEMFEAAVDRQPSKVALHFEERRLTFKELDAEANVIAQLLRKRGVGPDDLVGVCLERTPRLVASMFGIMKAGGAYVPLDPHYPPDRIRHVVNDSRAKVVITTRDLAEKLGSDLELLVLDGASLERNEARPRVPGSTSDLAYVIYTSGSTGKPKGVMLEHRNVVSFFAGMRDSIGLDDHGSWLAGTSVSFDISVLEILGSLTHGRSVVLLGESVLGEVQDARYTLPALALRHQVTHFMCTPSQAKMLVLNELGRNALRGLEQMIVGGEALPEDLAAELTRLIGGELVNGYGPTETTVFSTMARVHQDTPITIGRPIVNTCIFVLDKNGRLTPRGAIGELYIGGPGVARGYLGQPELTAERFVPNRIRPELSPRLYRTGDLVRHRNDGALEYIGRNDNQVKLRGYRIEVGEIEAVLRSQPGVADAAVLALIEPGGGRLLAYVVPGPDFAGEEALRKALKAKLPEYMVPAAFVRLDALPLTPNGKVDRKALPAIETAKGGGSTREFVRPPDELTQRLSAIWQRATGAERIGITDDFFELGGHSLVAVKIFNDIYSELGVQLPLSALFENPTVEQLAARIRAEQAAPADGAPRWSPLVPIQVGGRLPPFFCAAGLGGNPMNLRHVAAALGPEQPFYGMQYRGVDGGLPPHETMESMADELIQHIREVQPTGPYFLGGYSAGGVPAYEVACRLLKQGEQVGLLVLFDTINPTLPNFTFPERVNAHLKNLQENGPGYLGNRLRLGLQRRVERFQRGIRARLGSRYDYTYRHDAVEVSFLKAMREYRPPDLQGDLLLVQADFRFNASEGIGYRLDESNGWRRYIKGRFDIVKIDCDHVDVVSEHIAPIAGKIVRDGLTAARERLGIDVPPQSVRSVPPSRDSQRLSVSMSLK